MENQSQAPQYQSPPPYQYSSQQVAPPQQQSQYDYQSGPPKFQDNVYGQQRYGKGVKPKGDCCLGCSKKTWIIILVITIPVALIVIAGMSVGIYYAFFGFPTSGSSPADEDRLRCFCSLLATDPECKKDGIFDRGTKLCKKGQECYGKEIGRLGDTILLGCSDPSNYTCFVDAVADTKECWCDNANECISDMSPCFIPCFSGTQPKP